MQDMLSNETHCFNSNSATTNVSMQFVAVKTYNTLNAVLADIPLPYTVYYFL